MSEPVAPRERILAIAVLVWVTVQALLPAFIPRDETRQVEFAWELYSKGAPPASFIVHTPSGEMALLPKDVGVFNRAVVDYPKRLPPLLCERYGASRITVISGAERTEYPCE